MKSLIALVILTFFSTHPARAADVTVAVASNFLSTAEKLVAAYAEDTDIDVVLTHGSTGQIFAQISAGAPFDIFLSADAARPARLLSEGRVDEVRTYAFGRLMLVSNEPITEDTVAEQFAGQTIALADPTVAPYGLAATAAMERLGLDTATFQPILVANVGQVATIFATGNADYAFVAASLLPRLQPEHVFDLEGFYPPIQQDAARVAPAGSNPAADAFWDFLFSASAQSIISDAGYNLP